MGRAAKLTAVLLVLLMAGAPLVACMLPGGATSAEELACCREMGSDCGSDQMPSSHSCCKTIAQSAQLALTRTPFDLPHLLLISYLPLPVISDLAVSHNAFAPFAASDHSPPEAPPSSLNILRI